jgi:hypothetical protein|tara:strand:- start:1643 stop:2083 length:441 start_codon:yes stop_codon:yes gene_type:complete
LDNNRNIRKYNKELKGLRAILSDNEYTRTLTDGYHGFLADMHRKLIGNNTVTNKMLETINMASKYYDNYNKPETKAQRESMLVKITKLKVMLSQCGYTRQYEAEKMEFLDSLTNRAHSRGTLTPKQAKYANQMYKQFNKKIIPKSA